MGKMSITKKISLAFLGCVLVALLMFVLIGDSNSRTTRSVTASTSLNSAKIYSLATASLGGTYYIVGSGVAEAITDAIPNLTVNSTIAQGSLGNLLLLDSGEAELVMTNYYACYNAINKKPPFSKAINLAGICPLQYSVLQFCTFARYNDINTLTDLKGKKVSIGPAGGGGALLYKELLPFWGISENDTRVSNLSYSEGSDALSDKKIDVNVPHGAYPLEAISTLAAFSKIKILNLEAEIMERVLAKYPYYDIATIPAGTYKGIDQNVQSAGIQDILVVAADADEEEVYQITKAVYEGIQKLKGMHPSLANMTFDNYKDSLVPLHPGARRFYEEKNIPVK